MGLAGRKQRQRIPADPRNLSWANDASRFGLSYLSKFGWDASQGLGTSGDGIKSHLKVRQKLDMMGIGAQHLRNPNGIAWQQNKEFEALLDRLNANTERERESDAEETKAVRGREEKVRMGDKTFVRAAEMKIEEESRHMPPTTTRKKRKYKDPDNPAVGEKAMKKRKEKHQASGSDVPSVAVTNPKPGPLSIPSLSGPHPEPTAKPRPMAHRARIRAAKRIAGKSASAISEILGIAPSLSASTSMSTPVLTPPCLTPIPQSNSHSLDSLTTSTKSVADYFKEKLVARSAAPAALLSSSAPATPSLGAARVRINASCVSPLDGESELRRDGMGFRVSMISEVSEPGFALASAGNSEDVDGFMEKMHRKAECKAKKRRRREAETSGPISEKMCVIVGEQVGEQEAEGVTTSKGKNKKRTKRLAQLDKEPGTDNEGINECRTPNGSVPEPNKKSRKDHKKKCS